LSGDARRQELIDGAIRSVARHGVSGATVESICAQAGASTGLIRYHFGGKGKLLAAAYREIAKRFMTAIRTVEALEADDSLARLHAFIDVVHDPRQIGDDLASAWFGLWHAARFDADLRAINRDWYGEYRAYLAALIDQAARQHGTTVDAAQAAYGLIALTDGFWQELMVDPDAFDPKLARTISRGYVDRLLARPGD
jgi:TetR/AcrR family transcriptional regulator, transcriptional repressor of bet genes